MKIHNVRVRDLMNSMQGFHEWLVKQVNVEKKMSQGTFMMRYSSVLHASSDAAERLGNEIFEVMYNLYKGKKKGPCPLCGGEFKKK